MQKFCIFFPDGTPCWIFRAKTLSLEFWSLHWWYEYDFTIKYLIWDFQLIQLGWSCFFYMLVILGIMFREFKFRNIMLWLRDNHNLYLKYVWEIWNISVKKSYEGPLLHVLVWYCKEMDAKFFLFFPWWYPLLNF